MDEKTYLGTTPVRVSRLGTGVMTWGPARGAQRLMPAKSAYGGVDSVEDKNVLRSRPASQRV